MAALAGARDPRAPGPIAPVASTWSTTRRVIEHRALQYRRTFRASIFGSFVQPVLFLTAMGIGLGAYVNQAQDASLGGLTYIEFLAPGLLAAAVMQSGSFEAMFPIMGGLQWNRIFHAMYATPIRARDVALGNIVWIALRLTMIATVFAIVILLFGAAPSLPGLVLAVPAAVLCGMAFATPTVAFSATQRTPDRFAAILRFGVTPLFLFSGTFFPIESLPPFLQPIAWLSPLWHGVVLCRGLMLGTIGEEPILAIVHASILVALTVVGTILSIRTIRARLVRG